MNPGLTIKPVICSLLVLLLSIPLFSQDKNFTVSGKVLDEKTGQPMPGASVFCQNTTMGTTSNSEGHFFMRLASGGYDLVVSYTGYETKLTRISNGNKENDSLVITLKEQDKSLGEVVVAGSAQVADGWDKYGRFFLDNFIGTSPNADQCTIENKDALKFYFYKKRNKLKVKSDSSLIVVNNALGYKIKYQLDSFVFEYGTNISSYTGYPLFEELPGTSEQQDAWKQNRRNAYLGSRLHFMRSWYDSTLKDEGFRIEWGDSSDNNKFTPLADPYNSKYYGVDSGDVEIGLSGRIRVSYTGRAPDRKYLAEHKFPPATKQQISAAEISNGFVIEENGYFYDQADFINIGYWSWKKLADLLPYDYNPE